MQNHDTKARLPLPDALIPALMSLVALLSASDAAGGEFKYLEVKIVDPQGKPLPDATIEVWMDGVDFPLTTDEAGIASLNLPSKPNNRIILTVREAGYVAMRVSWNRGDEIPDKFTIPLQKGTSIGGIVQDERGQPIEGVQVKASAGVNPKALESGQIQALLSGEIAETDAEGRWRWDMAPRKHTAVQLEFVHPNFIRAFRSPIDEAAWKLLQENEYRTNLQPGISLGGIVSNERGEPIAGAMVALGTAPRIRQRPTTTTNEKGEYQFGNVEEGEVVVTVAANTYAPDLRKCSIQRNMKPVNFVLSSAKSVHLQVTSANGKPIPGVRIYPITWRNYPLPLGDSADVTDDNGDWLWNSAPVDSVDYTIQKDGFKSIYDRSILPSDEVQQIVMKLPQVATGRATDAKNGKPIEKFQVVKGIDSEDNSGVLWWNDDKQKAQQGVYRITSEFPDDDLWRVKIEAAGYRSQVSRKIRYDEGEVTIDFELEAGTGQRGTIKQANGEPAVQSQVALYAGKTWVQLNGGEIHADEAAASTYTDADGRFEFPAYEELAAVVAVSDYGWAMHYCNEDEDALDLVLEPWAQIAGVAQAGKLVLSGEKLMLTHPGIVRFDSEGPRINWVSFAETNGRGEFFFERVLARPALLARQVFFQREGELIGDLSSTTNNVSVEVTPGEVLRLVYGGDGRKLVGQLKMPAGYDNDVPWSTSVLNLSMEIEQPGKPTFYKHYAGDIQSDGSFTIDDVMPGEYEAAVHFYEVSGSHSQAWDITPSDGQINNRTENQLVTIPAATDGADTAVLDLGTVVLEIPDEKAQE